MPVTRRLGMLAVGVGVFGGYALAALGVALAFLWVLEGVSAWVLVAGLLVGVAVGVVRGYRGSVAELVAGVDARPLGHDRAPQLHADLEVLAGRLGVDPPALLVADLGGPNALSLGGPGGGAVVLDRRLFGLLDRGELVAILAHELAHLRGRDTLVMTGAVALVRALSGVVGLVLAPLALLAYGLDRGLAWARGRPAAGGSLGAWLWLGAQATVGLVLSLLTLAVLAYSRRREFVADRRAAAALGDGRPLARALWTLHRATRPDRGLRSLLYTHTEGGYRWLSTHPPVEERVRRLVGDDGVRSARTRHR